jgi:hypothetical protein
VPTQVPAASSPLPVSAAPTAAPSPIAPAGWVRVPDQDSVLGVQFQHVVWTGSRFVATGTALATNTGVFVDSADGVMWQIQTTQAADPLTTLLAAGPKGVVAIGSGNKAAAWASPDGLTWAVHRSAFRATGSGEVTVKGVIATDDGWLAVGRVDAPCMIDCGTEPLTPLVWTSTDGLAWTPVPTSGLTGGMNGVARTADGFVAVGQGKTRAAVWTSADGTTWKRVPDNPIFHGIGPQSGALCRDGRCGRRSRGRGRTWHGRAVHGWREQGPRVVVGRWSNVVEGYR